MREHFIGQEIRRCNRNLLIANTVFLRGHHMRRHECVLSGGRRWCGISGKARHFSLLAGWNLSKWKKQAREYTSHPIWKRPACFGTGGASHPTNRSGNTDEPSREIAGVRLFGPWLFKPSILGLTCFYVPDLVWVYRKVTTHSVNFIPDGQTSEALLYVPMHLSSKMQASKINVESLIMHISQKSPWILAGFCMDLEESVDVPNEHSTELIERRKQFYRKGASKRREMMDA